MPGKGGGNRKFGRQSLPNQIAEKVHFVFAGCGVTALSGLQNTPDSIHCRKLVGRISASAIRLFLSREQAGADFNHRFFDISR
ncbi:hypothetical protein DBY68_004340 [Pseudocitrobacter sp. RIT415]|nr:hypothetical protein DBY68_004340 [Pseudocitrobacter sp. RIT 415]